MAQSLCRRPPVRVMSRPMQAPFGKGLELFEVEGKGRMTKLPENRQSCREIWAEGFGEP